VTRNSQLALCFVAGSAWDPSADPSVVEPRRQIRFPILD
jgi:hypothetical protein